MILTQEQQAILNGEKGETLAKVMKTLVMYGDAFGAEKLVPITSKYNHLVTSFGYLSINGALTLDGGGTVFFIPIASSPGDSMRVYHSASAAAGASTTGWRRLPHRTFRPRSAALACCSCPSHFPT